jgi:hypothetical protein
MELLWSMSNSGESANLKFSSDGKRLYVADNTGISIWDTKTLIKTKQYIHHSYNTPGFAFSEDETRLAFSCNYKDVFVLDTTTGIKYSFNHKLESYFWVSNMQFVKETSYLYFKSSKSLYRWDFGNDTLEKL